MVYTSATLSLAALELFVHLDTDLLPDSLIAIAAEIPAELAVASLDVADLPPEWRTYPAPEVLQDLGTEWVLKGMTAVLSVPSVVIPAERNDLFNPAHPGFARIVLQELEPFRFDPRMWKTAGRSI